MPLDPSISFRHMETSEAVEALIREKVAKLETFYDRISHCDVVLEEPHRSHTKGDHFHVRIRLTVPGEEIVVDNTDQDKHEDAMIAVRDAFEIASRKVKAYAARKREEKRQSTK